jgi:hypothetical protein
VKSSQRLDYSSLAASLGQKGLVEPQRLSMAMQAAEQSRLPFPEVLVGDGLISDWDLSRTVCELYNLAFVPVDAYPPNIDALEGLDLEFLRANRLVPLDRYGNLLTVAMPGIVPAEVLGMLAAQSDLHVLPVVGTVQSNNRWLIENIDQAAQARVAEPKGKAANLEAAIDDEWSNIFDEGDAAVLETLSLDPSETELEDVETPGALPAPKEEGSLVAPEVKAPPSEAPAKKQPAKERPKTELPPMPEL